MTFMTRAAKERTVVLRSLCERKRLHCVCGQTQQIKISNSLKSLQWCEALMERLCTTPAGLKISQILSVEQTVCSKKKKKQTERKKKEGGSLLFFGLFFFFV